MFDFEVVGYAFDHEIYCVDCSDEEGAPVFAGHEEAADTRCSSCGVVLTGDDKTVSEMKNEREKEDALAAAFRKETEDYIKKQIAELDEDVEMTVEDLKAIQEELAKKREAAKKKKEELRKKLEEGDEG